MAIDLPGRQSLINAALGLALIGGGALTGGFILQFILGSPGQDLSAQLTAPPGVERIPPELPGARGHVEAVAAQDYMIVAAHPVASQVGAAILDRGGSAVDAIIAAQMVLTLVEPQSSGIGGGAFMLVWDDTRSELFSYDGRETAPAAGNTDYLRDQTGAYRPFMEVVTGGASVGVPGLMRMLDLAHRNHGTQDWASLFRPAITLAEDGFPVSPRLHTLLQEAPFLIDMEAAGRYFYDSETGEPWPVGTRLRNPDLAASLRTLAQDGADALYEGPLAEAIVTAVQTASRNPGTLTLSDMAGYQAKRRENLCLEYRDFNVCGMGPPSSGGSTVLQILGLMEHSERDIRHTEPLSADGIQIFAEAMRLAFADRDRYIADADFVPVPVTDLLAEAYLRDRATLMDFGMAEKQPQPPGNPLRERVFRPDLLDDSPELPATSHLVAVDRTGTVATMTSSIETGFGSRVMVGGFLLNNQLTDFSWTDERDGEPVANRYEPGKRPRSSMAPILVFDADGKPLLALGSPGGSRIIGFVAKTLTGVLDWDMSLQESIEMTHFLNRNGDLEIEADPSLDPVAATLAARGYKVTRSDMASGLHGVELLGRWLYGGADPRREGRAVGEKTLEPDLEAVFQTLLPKSDPSQ